MPQWQSLPNLPRGESREISYILVGSGFAYRSLGPRPQPRERVAPVAVRARLRWVAAPLSDRSWDRRGGWRVGRASLVEKPDRPCAYRGDGHDDLGPRPHGAGGPAARRLREDTA